MCHHCLTFPAYSFTEFLFVCFQGEILGSRQKRTAIVLKGTSAKLHPTEHTLDTIRDSWVGTALHFGRKAGEVKHVLGNLWATEEAWMESLQHHTDRLCYSSLVHCLCQWILCLSQNECLLTLIPLSSSSIARRTKGIPTFLTTLFKWHSLFEFLPYSRHSNYVIHLGIST